MQILLFIGFPIPKTCSPLVLPPQWISTTKNNKVFIGKRLPHPHPTIQEIFQTISEVKLFLSHQPAPTSSITIFPETLIGST